MPAPLCVSIARVWGSQYPRSKVEGRRCGEGSGDFSVEGCALCCSFLHRSVGWGDLAGPVRFPTLDWVLKPEGRQATCGCGATFWNASIMELQCHLPSCGYNYQFTEYDTFVISPPNSARGVDPDPINHPLRYPESDEDSDSQDDQCCYYTVPLPSREFRAEEIVSYPSPLSSVAPSEWSWVAQLDSPREPLLSPATVPRPRRPRASEPHSTPATRMPLLKGGKEPVAPICCTSPPRLK